MAAAERVAEVERRLYQGLAAALDERDVAAIVRGLRKLVEGREAGEAIERRRGG